MPEGPECKIMADYLHSSLKNKVIKSAKIIDGRYFSTTKKPRSPPKNWESFTESLPLNFEYATAKGKTIYMKIGDFYVVSKLGMTGRWNKIATINTYLEKDKNPHKQIEFEFEQVEGTKEEEIKLVPVKVGRKPNQTKTELAEVKEDKKNTETKYKKSRPKRKAARSAPKSDFVFETKKLKLEDKNEESDENVDEDDQEQEDPPKLKIEINPTDLNKIWYCDPRRFGSLEIATNQAELDKILGKLGPDLLANDDDNVQEFLDIARLKKHQNKTLPKFLMDQSIVSGVGNYIKCEAMYMAKISPFRIIEKITDEELTDLYSHLRWVMKTSYGMSGNTIKTYYSPDGGTGNFFDLLQVYAREKDDNGYKVETVKTADGRTTHWVKKVQK